MNERKPLNVDACNLEEVRGVIRDAEANFVAMFDELRKLRKDSEARPEPIGARPT